MKIVVVYHACFLIGDPPELKAAAFNIVSEFMQAIQLTGLLGRCDELIVGLNGGPESEDYALMTMPSKAKVVYHGVQCRNENRTILEIEKHVRSHSEEAFYLYAHAKGSSHELDSDYGKFVGRWRRCMLGHLVGGWQNAVYELERGCQAVGCHWMQNQGHDQSQHYFAGGWWWATASFLRGVPSLLKRDRIKVSGIESPESRYESEVWLCNEGRIPIHVDLAPDHGLLACP
jgi:hypothetical protein